ncbi:hypothetical protein [Luteibacter aegosomatissinici]|jgi:hypothetical protein|uniref:hypothetical protein n=1 Tax=Luteibacter aegosomatissinici TaxID=2911539 RepID=UPI001FF92752|nr:hypothetical protein [Luteibacter aegosomatissinici]UPG93137.1 hypothetical protein L2Y97_14835 [Luteibacter aegosomatissinici]
MDRAITLDEERKRWFEEYKRTSLEMRKMYAELDKLEYEKNWYPFWIGVGLVTSILTSLATFATLLFTIARKI